jgi:hypothetical protein
MRPIQLEGALVADVHQSIFSGVSEPAFPVAGHGVAEETWI